MPRPGKELLALIAAGVVLGGLGLVLNPVFTLLVSPIVVSCVLALSDLRFGLPLVLFWLAFADFFKRLLLLAPAVSRVEWWGMVAVPDVVIACVLVRLLFDSTVTKRITWRRSPLDVPVGIFLIWCVLQIANPRGTVVIGLAGFKLVGPYIMLYFVGSGLLRGAPQLTRFRAWVIGLALLTAGYGMWQSVAGMAPFEQRWLWEGYTDLGVPVLLQYGVLRAFSTFSDPHAYGFFLAGALLCLLGASLEEHAGRARHLGTAVVLSVALMLTLARAPWAVVAFGGMLIWALQRPDQRSVRVALLAILTLAVLVVPFAVQTTVKRIPSAFVRRALTTGTFVARTEAWRAFLVDSSLRPPLGYGMGMASYARRKFTGEIGPTPHNQLLAVLYETGWVGLLLFLWILARAFRCILSLVRQPPSLWPQLVPAVGYVAGITFVGLIMMNFWDSRIAASLFWLGLGAVSVASSGFQRREAVPT